MTKVIETPMTRHDFVYLIDAYRVSQAVEVGVATGDFSYYLLKHSRIQLLWSVDSWSGTFTKYKALAVSNLIEFGDRSVIQHMPSSKAAQLAESTEMTFGFVYIDAKHQQRAVENDIACWLPRLQRPGIIGGHDYMEAKKNGVIEAVDSLATEVDQPVYLTREPWASWFFLL